MKRFLLPRIGRASPVRLSAIAGLIFALVVSGIAPAFAAGGQTGAVTGTVVTAAGAPVSGAMVGLASASGNFVQRSDAHGHFSFLGVPIDTYHFTVQAQGYELFQEPAVTITGGGTVDLGNVRVTTALRTIARTTSRSATNAFQPNQTIPQFTVSGQQLEAAQGKQASSNGADALLAVPGFQRDFAGNLILQGSLTDQIRYSLDGVDFTDPGFNRPANNGAMAGGGGDFFNGVGSLQVVPGAGDPSQGNSGAGAVNLVVKRGTYPGSGLFDVESDVAPYSNQVNIQYGIASKNQRFSDYISYFSTRADNQIGNFGVNPFDVNAAYSSSATNQSDFLNNFVFRFGKSNSQALQVLYLNDYQRVYGNYGNLINYYPGVELAPYISPLGGLTTAQQQSILGPEQNQTTQTGPIPNNITANNNTSLLKFEYDNTFNASTYLALRYFTQSTFQQSFTNGATQQPGPPQILRTAQTAGGSRIGANFDLDKQVDPHNLLSLSGSFEFSRPNFGSFGPYVGLTDLGSNAQDFLRPPNPSAPVSPSNPCPVMGGCYLQQFFYQQGGTPRVPPLVLQSSELQDTYGLGLRDQIQVNSRLRLDLGARYDLINEGFGPNLYYADEATQPIPGSPAAFYLPNYGFANTPHFIEPRASISFLATPNDNVAFSYGRAIILQGLGEVASPEALNTYARFNRIPLNPNFVPDAGDAYIGYAPTGNANCYPYLPFPVGATSSSQPSFHGTTGGASPGQKAPPGATLQFGRPCANYGELLFAANDAFYPEVGAIQPGVFNEYDFTYAHQFRNGSSIKIDPYYRQGAEVQVATANLIDINGSFQPGTLTNTTKGISKTSGLDVQYTLPNRPYGLTGFLSLSYVNEFTNTPPSSDNPNPQDFEPYISAQSLAAGNVYRAGFVSPFSAQLGLSYKTHNGFRFNPVLGFNIGFPYGAGLLTPFVYGAPGAPPAINVPNTNYTNQYSASGAPQYFDPSNPGSIFAPNIAATRGTPEKPSGGGELSQPQVTGNMTVEYDLPGTRATVGVQVLNIFGNEYGLAGGNGNVLASNGTYYPVTTGVAGPLTGQNFNNTFEPSKVPLTYSALNPYGPYNLGVSTPPIYRLYLQYAL